jgi:hypothetical protein
MADEPNTSVSTELPPLPKAPWVTMLTALLILFFFAAMVVVVLHYAENIGAAPASASGENQLKELRASESETLNSHGYDPQTKSYRIPIDRAINALIDEANGNGGQLKSFPAAPKKK